jgi:hypothetical protein
MKKVAPILAFMLVLFPLCAWGAYVSVDLDPIAGTPLRWLDIADFEYSDSYQSAYSYAQASVTLTYEASSTTFSGSLTSTGLKPNFAYQMKLVGYGSDSSDPTNLWTNEQLGYAGRWWRAQPNPGNANDADYELHKTDPGYLYQGYLLFAYFVTDAQGTATTFFSADSSFHVLWVTHDSTGDGPGHRDRTANDGPVTYYDFTASDGVNPSAYDTNHGAAHVGLYGEWEGGTRALPGQLVLPLGTYSCQFILTEESFHQSGLGGGWASVLGAPVQFEVVPLPPSLLLLGSGLLGLGLLGWRKKKR